MGMSRLSFVTGDCRSRAAGLALVGLLLAAGAVGLHRDRDVAAAPPPSLTAPAGAETTLDKALALLADSRRHFQGVTDYVCTLGKQERVGGKLLPENVMTLRVRNRPFSVHLRWQQPKSVEGQEVCYVAGRNGGMMRVHPVGIAGILGFISLSPEDPRAMKESRHPITRAGLGYLLDSVARQWELEKRWNKTVVRIVDCELNHRPCTWIETTHPDRAAGSFYGYRCVLCIDKETHLPVHSAAYDWPRPGSDANGDLLESYTYWDFRANVGLSDETFDH